ncbi:MAG: hypothetical protein ACI31R_03120 [Bacilli bacterium]
MKKVIKLLIGIFVLVLIFELIAYIFKTHHEVTYTLKDDNQTFKINEIYKNKKYYFKITNKDLIYSFEIPDEFHKRKEIINKIYSYQKDDLYCIYPAIEKGESTNILCSKNKKSYSYTNYEKYLGSFVETLKKQGYDSPSWEKQSNKSRQIETLTAYQNNIKEKTYIYIYKYNGFFAITKDSLEQIKLFENDTYINHLGTTIDKYYLIPNYDQKYDYDELYVIDMTKNKVKQRKLKYKISKDSYINGVIEDEVYIFDKDELKQYKISKKGKKIKEVGNKEDGALFYNLKFETKSVYDFRDEELKFKTMKDYISQIEKNTSINYLQSAEDTYYYQTKNNDVYYYNINNKTKVLLFNKEISDFTLVKDTLYFISEDNLYSYDFKEGLRKLITYSELSFNSKNRLAIYME